MSKLTLDIQEKLTNASEMALEEVARAIYEKSQEYVPVQTGNLRDSGSYTVKDARAVITYDADYALQVHENLNSRGAKYLERAIAEVDAEAIFISAFKENI